jgi:hypothetical protein
MQGSAEEAVMETTGNLARRAMWILWPAFLAAGVAEAVFFTVFDPFELHAFGAPLDLSREAMYTMGFFGFWLLAMTSSALTLLLEGTLRKTGPAAADRAARPEGCPMQDDAQCRAVRERQRP